MRLVETTEIELTTPLGTNLFLLWEFTVKRINSSHFEDFSQNFYLKIVVNQLMDLSFLSPCIFPYFLRTPEFSTSWVLGQFSLPQFSVVVFPNFILTPPYIYREHCSWMVFEFQRETAHPSLDCTVLNAHCTEISVLMAKFRRELC